MEPEQQSSSLGKYLFVGIVVIAAGVGLYARSNGFNHGNLMASALLPAQDQSTQAGMQGTIQTPADAVVAVTSPTISHLPTPDDVHGIYISGWSAGTRSSMDHIYNLIAGGKLNSVVIDIKDATGQLSYEPLDPTLRDSGVGTHRIANLNALIATLHSKNIYVIGRVAVFQDPFYAAAHPEDALHSIATGDVWKDPKGIAWLRTDSTDVWHYTETIAEDAYAQGFDEIQVDYVRFPSDGKLKDIDESTFAQDKQDTVTSFFVDLDATLRQKDHIPLSADVFGLTSSASDDMGIGQKLEPIAEHVDFISPMVYPSHFANGSYGFAKPAEHPYDIIHRAMSDAVAKLDAVGVPPTKLRPWLQDFNLGATYTADMAQTQADAANDVGVQSWLYWDAANLYTSAVFK